MMLMKEMVKSLVNGKIVHAYGLRELILSKYLYYPKQYTDLI